MNVNKLLEWLLRFLLCWDFMHRIPHALATNSHAINRGSTQILYVAMHFCFEI